MKKLQSELQTAQTKKQARQAELETLQEQASQMIAQLEEEKTSRVQMQADTAALRQEEIIVQTIEALIGKVVHIRERGKELKDKFHNLAKVVQGACKGCSTTTISKLCNTDG
jgi:hypothetical protein